MRRAAIGLHLTIGLAVAACSATAGDRTQSSREPSDAELVAVQNDEDVFPPAFRGKWGVCGDPDGKGLVRITAKRMTGYESDAVLLKGAMEFEAAPGKQQAYTLTALVAESGEGEMGIVHYRISLSQGQLYVRNEGADRSQYWNYPMNRCSA